MEPASKKQTGPGSLTQPPSSQAWPPGLSGALGRAAPRKRPACGWAPHPFLPRRGAALPRGHTPLSSLSRWKLSQRGLLRPASRPGAAKPRHRAGSPSLRGSATGTRRERHQGAPIPSPANPPHTDLVQGPLGSNLTPHILPPPPANVPSSASRPSTPPWRPARALTVDVTFSVGRFDPEEEQRCQQGEERRAPPRPTQLRHD